MSNQMTTQALLVDDEEFNENRSTMRLALFNAEGEPVTIGEPAPTNAVLEYFKTLTPEQADDLVDALASLLTP